MLFFGRKLSYQKTIKTRSFHFFLLTISLVFGFVFFGSHFKNNFKQARYYQSWFAPAVNFACGRGFKGVKWDDSIASTKLRKFLYQKPRVKHFIKSLTCEEIKDLKLTKAGPSALAHRYLVQGVGLVWRLKGIHWRHSYIMAGFLGALSALGITLLFSLLLPLEFAVPLMMLVSTNGLLQDWTLFLRDFSKAPFFFLLVFLLFKLLGLFISNARLGAVTLYSILSGLVLGISLGFRLDLFILLLPALSFFFLPLFLYKKRKWVHFAIPLICFIAMIFISAQPVLKVFNKSHATWHVVLLGIADGFNSNLGLYSHSYSKLPKYIDGLVMAKVFSFNSRAPKLDEIIFKEKGYDQVGGQLFYEWVHQFPYDFWIRMEKSLFQVLDMPGEKLLKGWASGVWQWWSFLMFFATFAFLALFPLPISIIFLFFNSFCFTFPSLQFASRHYFHLEPIALLYGLLPLTFFSAEKRQNITNSIELNGRKILLRAVFLSFILLLVFIIIPASLKSLQIFRMKGFIDHLADLQKVEQPLRVEVSDSSTTYRISSSISNGERPWDKVEYFEVFIDLEKCRKAPFSYKALWNSHWRGYDFSFEKSDPKFFRGKKNLYVYIPSHRINDSYFSGFQVPAKSGKHCKPKISRIVDISDLKVLPLLHLRFPLLESDLYFSTGRF